MRLSLDAIQRVVWLHAEDANHRDAAGAVIHELGHLHATRDCVEDTDEFHWLGWEIAVAREARVRTVWDATMHDYQVLFDDFEGSWREVDRAERLEGMRDRLAAAQATGIVDASGQALWIGCPPRRGKGAKSQKIHLREGQENTASAKQ